MKEQIALEPISSETCLVRATHNTPGRTTWVKPGDTASRNLYYGRVILMAGDKAIEFDTGERETGLICLRGSGIVRTNGQEFGMSRYDALYVPRDSRVVVECDGDFDLAEVAAPVDEQYPVQFVSFEEIRKDSALHFKAGAPPTERDLNILLGKNIQAGRIMAGVTFSSEGNWTSWPPHEHENMLEEAYLYIDMPDPQWGIQLVYTDRNEPELVQVIREGDVVLMPQGYHPNVAAPGGQINFLWMMAANREGVDRQFGVVNVQPEYSAGGSGLEASQK